MSNGFSDNVDDIAVEATESERAPLSKLDTLAAAVAHVRTVATRPLVLPSAVDAIKIPDDQVQHKADRAFNEVVDRARAQEALEAFDSKVSRNT